MATYNEEYVEKFLNGEISYEDFVRDGQANSKLWQDFLYTMFTKGVLGKDQYDPSAAGGKIDKMSDLDNNLNVPGDEWGIKTFFNTDRVKTEWNESMNEIRLRFIDFFKDYVGQDYPDPEQYSLRAQLIEILKNSDAAFDFEGEPWATPLLNKDGKTYSEVRGSDKIETVLNSNSNLQFTCEQDEEDFIVRLIMPKYSRRVEIEDLNRNFWTIAQALTNLIKLVTGTDSPIVLILRDLIKETTELWQNVYYLWAAVAGLEDKFESLQDSMKEIESGGTKTPLNIHLHFPSSNNILATETWLRLFKTNPITEDATSLYELKDQIKSFTLKDVYYFGSNIARPDWLTAPTIPELYGINWLFNGNNFIYQPGRKYYPAYNGQGLTMPGTERFFMKPFSEIENIINSPYPVEITKEEDLIYGISSPRLGAVALASVEFKDGEKQQFITAYDIGHPFVNTHLIDIDENDTEQQINLKAQKINQLFWDILAYANYDPQGDTVEIVQNRILYENLPWTEEKLDNGKTRIYTSDDINLDHTVNQFANLIYERGNGDKKDMAQIIRDVAAFNYVYRVKNNLGNAAVNKVWNLIPYELGIRPDPVQYLVDFLYYLADLPTDSFDSTELTGEALQNVRGGLPRILSIINTPRSNKYQNFDYLLDSPKLANVKLNFYRYNKAIKEKKLDLLMNLFKETYKLFGFDYDRVWEDLEAKGGATITGEDSDYSNYINENFVHMFIQSFGELIGKELSYTTEACKAEARAEFNNYIENTLAQTWIYKYQKCTPNPFLIMKPVTSWDNSYTMSEDCGFEGLKYDYSLNGNSNPIIFEIIATGTDETLACFVNDYYKQFDGRTPIIEDMVTNADEENFGQWHEVCIPMVNRVMKYKKQDGMKGPYIELQISNQMDLTKTISNTDTSAEAMYSALTEHGIIQGFSIVAADQYPQVKRDYLASYIQTDFGTVTNYDFRFVDNRGQHDYGDYDSQIINYTIRHIKAHNITGSINPGVHMDCHNCSLNIPYNLVNTASGVENNRLTDIFSVGVPVASSTSYSNIGSNYINPLNVYEINHGKGYIYRAINGDLNKLGIADGVFGVHSAYIDLNSETTQAQSPYMSKIITDGWDQRDPEYLPFHITAQQEWLTDHLKDGGTLSYYDALNQFLTSNFDQYYDNADNAKNFLEADKQFTSTNIVSPTLAFSGEDGGTVNLMDMYISTALSSLPYYRKEHLTPHGDSYKGFTTYGKDYVKPLENYHQLTKREQIYNQEYTNFNDIYIRDILPRPEQRIKPKLYADISVFSDLSTVFELKFLKDENRIKFPGLSETVESEIDIETDLNINFVKIGNTMSSSNWNYKFEDNKPTMIYAGDINRTKTNYIYNFNYENNGNKYSESDGYLLLHDYENGVLKPKSYPMSSGGFLAQIANGNKEELIKTAGFNTITDFYKNNRDSYYSPDTTKISYFVTSIGRESEHLNYSQQYWKASTLCHIFMFVPTILVSGGTTIDIADKVKQVFGNNYTEIAGKGYLYCIGTVNKTEGFFNFSQGSKDKAEQVGGGGYYGNRWRQPFIKITSGGAQIKQTIRTTTYAGGSKTEEIETNIEAPNTIELSCGMWDIRLRDSGSNLSEDKYTLIKGDFKIDLNGSATLEPVNNFRYCNRKGQSYEDINNTPIIPNGTALKNVDKNNNIFDSDNLIENSIFTDGAIFDFS